MNYFTRSTIVMVILALLLAVFAGCNVALKQTNPKLPPGFTEAQVPTGENLSAYLYVSQQKPVVIDTARFGDITKQIQDPVLKRVFVVPHVLEVRGLAVSVGSDLDSFAGNVRFTTEEPAFIAEQLLAGRPEVSGWRDGMVLNLVRGSGPWADAMTSSLKSMTGSKFQDAYPKIWELMRVLPEQPPMEPVVAGFVHVDTALLDSLSARAGLDLGGVGQALGAINVSDIVFAGYAGAPLELPKEITQQYLQKADLGAIFLAQSSYPGFALGFFLNSFADKAGLKKGTKVSGEDVLSREMEGMHLLVKPLGNTLILVLASNQGNAEKLMASVLEPQLKK